MHTITLHRPVRVYAEGIGERLSLEHREYLPEGQTITIVAETEKQLRHERHTASAFDCSFHGRRWVLNPDLADSLL